MVKDNWIPFPLKLLATKAATLALRAWEEPCSLENICSFAKI